MSQSTSNAAQTAGADDPHGTFVRRVDRAVQAVKPHLVGEMRRLHDELRGKMEDGGKDSRDMIQAVLQLLKLKNKDLANTILKEKEQDIVSDEDSPPTEEDEAGQAETPAIEPLIQKEDEPAGVVPPAQDLTGPLYQLENIADGTVHHPIASDDDPLGDLPESRPATAGPSRERVWEASNFLFGAGPWPGSRAERDRAKELKRARPASPNGANSKRSRVTAHEENRPAPAMSSKGKYIPSGRTFRGVKLKKAGPWRYTGLPRRDGHELLEEEDDDENMKSGQTQPQGEQDCQMMEIVDGKIVVKRQFLPD